MQITDLIAQTGGLRSIARELGINEAEAAKGAAALAPAVLGGFKKQAQSSGLEGLGGMLGKLGLTEPPTWWGVTGPMLMCNRDTYQRLRGLGLFQRNVLPKSKFESNGWERLVGMMLAHLGIPISHEVSPWMTKHYRERG